MNALAVTPVLAAAILELNPGLVLWTAITFLVLILVLARFAFRPIVKMLDDRERTIRETIDQAKKERADAEKLLTDQREALTAARREASELTKKNQQQVEALRAELTTRAKKEADEVLAAAKRQIDEERVKVVAELKGQVVDLAIDAASRILKVGLDEKAQRTLVEEYIKQLPSGRA